MKDIPERERGNRGRKYGQLAHNMLLREVVSGKSAVFRATVRKFAIFKMWPDTTFDTTF